MRVYGTEAVLSIRDRRVELHRPDASTIFEFPEQDGGYVGEFQNFHEAVVHGAPVIGTLAQSIRGMEIVTKALRSAEGGETILLDDSPVPLSTNPLQMWMPHDAATLHIPKETSHERRD